MGGLLAHYSLQGTLDNFHQEYMEVHWTDPRLRFKTCSSRYKFGIWSQVFTQQNQNQVPTNSRGQQVDMSTSVIGLRHLSPPRQQQQQQMNGLAENGNLAVLYPDLLNDEMERFHALEAQLSMDRFDELTTTSCGTLSQATTNDEDEKVYVQEEEEEISCHNPSTVAICTKSGSESGSGTVNAIITKSKLTMTRDLPAQEILDVNTGDSLGNCKVDEKHEDQENHHICRGSDDKSNDKLLLEMGKHPE